MNRLLLNADLGEWESAANRAAIFPHLDLANVACGGHAGSPETLASCADLAEQWQVKLGAHPGTPANKGRGQVQLTRDEFRNLLLPQIDTFLDAGLALNHLKLHGSLYHLSEANPSICEAYLSIVKKLKVPVICLANGAVAAACEKEGINYLPEAFLDRTYQANGQLMPRAHPQSSLNQWPEQQQRIEQLTHGQPIEAIDGSALPIKARTLCIHADHPGSAELAAKARLNFKNLSR